MADVIVDDLSYQPMCEPGFERVMVVLTVMMVAVIEVLDMTIVSVALPHMMGAMGANSQQITWVVTSYIVSSAIVMLMSGFLIGRFGCRQVMFVGVLGFMIASVLCGLATSLEALVFFRILQGTFGAVLVPLSQFVIRRSFNKVDQAKGMAIWGVGIMVAPILGPTLGGYITDLWSWRWIFYINVPVCLVALLLTTIFIKKTPISPRIFDWVGMIIMAIGVGALQLFLDRGNAAGWFDSRSIQITFLVMVFFIIFFVVRGRRHENNILNLKIFRNRNFVIASILMAVYCGGFFGIVTIQPIMLERLMGYPAVLAGLVVAPRGITSAIAMLCVARLMRRFDPRWPVLLGLCIAIYTAYLLAHLSLEASFSVVMGISAIQGFATGLFFVPLSTLAFSTLSHQEAVDAAGVFSFSRNLGISIGTAILGTIITRQTQANWNQLGSHFNLFNPNFHHWLQVQNLNLHNPLAIAKLSHLLGQQSAMIAYLDAYWFVMCALSMLLIPVLFLRFK